MATNNSPKDAAAVVLLKSGANAENPELFWIRRNPKLSFLGGYHAFPGGKLEKPDFEVPVENCANTELGALITCAARETFEETSVLLARGGEKFTKGQRASLHDDLCSGRMTFGEILEHWNLWLNSEDFKFVGTWTTPTFSPVRFRTRFFLAVCPPKQQPHTASGELEAIESISAKEALERWRKGEILCAPPILHTVRVFSNAKSEIKNAKFDLKSSDFELITFNLLSLAEKEGSHPRKIEFNPRFTCFPIQTETLPPATHTNCFIVGRKEFVVIDAAAKDENEQTALHEFIDETIGKNGVCKAIIVSHFHQDHMGGETALQTHLQTEFGVNVPILTHQLTAEHLKEITFDGFLEDGDIFELKDENGEAFKLEILHAPGHARGHLCFYDAEIGFLLSSDNIVGTGSVLIAPPEGNMRDYLASLERLKNLPNLRFLCGSHGAAIVNAKAKIETYIAHRLEREQRILEAVNNGAKTPSEIVERVYTDVKPELWSLAEKSILAHLGKLREEKLI